jgi:UDP-N-acetylmuramate: L-alanyl-gamma-D-glutamyl-meso-diaminopimelate ligase
MKRGVHKETLAASLAQADVVFLYQPDNIEWSVEDIAQQCQQSAYASDSVDVLVQMVTEQAQPGDQILVMSNGGFEGIHDKLLAKLAE